LSTTRNQQVDDPNSLAQGKFLEVGLLEDNSLSSHPIISAFPVNASSISFFYFIIDLQD